MQAKTLGKMCLINTLAGLEAFTLRLWTGVLGLSVEQVKEDLEALRKDFANPQIHAYWPLYGHPFPSHSVLANVDALGIMFTDK